MMLRSLSTTTTTLLVALLSGLHCVVHPVQARIIPPSSTTCASDTGGNTYHVGPGQTYATIGAAPLDTLEPGDWVCIHYSATPYAEKFVLNVNGNATHPIVVTGVASADDPVLLPIIDAAGATTPTYLNYWNEDRSLIKIGAASYPTGTASYIRVQYLKLQNAHPNYTFTDDTGAGGKVYRSNAACVHVEQGSHIEIVGNEITACGNGIFIGGPNVSDILIERNYIYGNGISGSIYEHNTYTEAAGITYQYNRFGELCSDCLGNNLKDRSAGLVVAYNFIQGGNRQLDLVDSSNLVSHPDYDETHVYGNLLVEYDLQGNRQMVNFGGDSGNTANYRSTLYFYHNTALSTRAGKSTLLRLGANSLTAYLSNNVLVATGAESLELLADNGPGTVYAKHNLISDNYVHYYFGSAPSNVVESGTVLESQVAPVFSDASYDAEPYNLQLAGSLLFGTALEAGSPAVTSEYVMHTASQSRSTLDLGAYGYGTPAPTISPFPSSAPSESKSPSVSPSAFPSTSPSVLPTKAPTAPINCSLLGGKDACNAEMDCFWCDANGDPTNSGKPGNTCCSNSSGPTPTPPTPTPPTPTLEPPTCPGTGEGRNGSCTVDSDCISCKCKNNGRCQ